MGIRLFPEHFLAQDECFGLFKMAEDGVLDLPITIQSDGRIPLHIVHSDPDHLAYLAGLLVLQAWLYGIDELEVPPTLRRPLLIVTDSPGRFAEAYVKLHIPNEGLKRLCKQRRIALSQKLDRATNPKNKREYWDQALGDDAERTKLHNFFPAKQVLHANAKPRLIASRDHLGRGDAVGAAVFIIRSSRQISLVKLEDSFRPFLILIDADGVAVPESRMEVSHGRLPRVGIRPGTNTEREERDPRLLSARCPIRAFLLAGKLASHRTQGIGLVAQGMGRRRQRIVLPA